MKKILLSGALAACAAASQAVPMYQWNYLIDTASAQDNASKVVLSSDGHAVTLSHFGSKTTNDLFLYDGEKIAIGSAIDGNSDNRNLVVMKHSEDGKKIWAFSTSQGYVDTTSADIIATPDGGMVLFLAPRGSKVEDQIYAPVFVSASGEETAIENWNTSGRIYNAVIVKISSAGELEWYKVFRQDQSPINGKETLDGISTYAMTCDAAGNIYVGGNYRSSLVMEGDGHSCYVLAPRNVKSYSGDSQTAAGGMFLIKLNSEGVYSGHVSSSGEVTRDQISALGYADGKIYFCGNLIGKADESIRVGAQSLILEDSLDKLIYGCVDCITMEVEWLKKLDTYGASDGKSTLQSKAIDIIDGNVYMTGALKGGLGDGDPVIRTSGTMLEGFAVKVSAADGKFIDGRIYGTGISAWLRSIKIGNEVYLYGYRMNANEGVTLRPWTETSSEGICSIITGGGAPIAYDCAYDADKDLFYSVSRGNKAFTFPETDVTSEAPSGFGSVFAAFRTKDVSTVVSSIGGEPSLHVEGGKHQIKVSAKEDLEIKVIDMGGITVCSVRIQSGERIIHVPSGIYMVNGRKVIVN